MFRVLAGTVCVVSLIAVVATAAKMLLEGDVHGWPLMVLFAFGAYMPGEIAIWGRLPFADRGFL